MFCIACSSVASRRAGRACTFGQHNSSAHNSSHLGTHTSVAFQVVPCTSFGGPNLLMNQFREPFWPKCTRLKKIIMEMNSNIFDIRPRWMGQIRRVNKNYSQQTHGST